MAVTIHDVAQDAKVSPKTVSRVLNNEPSVREETKNRILASVERLGYEPNASAQRLARGRSRIIVLLFPQDVGYFFYSLTYRLLLLGQDTGYDILPRPCDVVDSHERSTIVRLIKRQQADGLIFLPPCDMIAGLLEDVDRLGCPIVLLHPEERSTSRPYVTVAEKQGVTAVTEHLLRLGHRHIGFIKGPASHRASWERFEGFQAALTAHGIQREPGLVRQGDFSFESGFATGLDLLTSSMRPSAILAGNDDMALGAMKAAHKLGLNVPRDLSIAGFDDVEQARQTWPPLTTVRQPTEQIARCALDLLLQIMDGKHPDSIQHVLPTQMMIRASTCEPAD